VNKKIIVNEEKILLEFLKEKLKDMSKNNVKNLLTKKRIKVNGKVITKHDYLLKLNDVIEIGNTEISTEFNNIKIIYEDEHLIAVNKPSGLLTIANEKEKEKTLYNIVRNYMKEKNKFNKIFIVHRLDKDTSGVVLFAKNEKIKNLLQNNWNNITKRIYYAVVEGNTKEKETLKSYLKENKNLETYSSNTGDLAITKYEKIKSNNEYSLLKIEIKTGRKNQIRVQLSDIGNPIVGDNKYGRKNQKIKRMLLHAETLEILNPITNKKMIFQSTIPEIFNEITFVKK